MSKNKPNIQGLYRGQRTINKSVKTSASIRKNLMDIKGKLSELNPDNISDITRIINDEVDNIIKIVSNTPEPKEEEQYLMVTEVNRKSRLVSRPVELDKLTEDARDYLARLSERETKGTVDEHRSPFFQYNVEKDLEKIKSALDPIVALRPGAGVTQLESKERERVQLRSVKHGFEHNRSKLENWFIIRQSSTAATKAMDLAVDWLATNHPVWKENLNRGRPVSWEKAWETMPKTTAAMYPYMKPWRKYTLNPKTQEFELIEDNFILYYDIARSMWNDLEHEGWNHPSVVFTVTTGKPAKADKAIPNRFVQGAPGAMSLLGKRFTHVITQLLRGQLGYVSLSSQKETDTKVNDSILRAKKLGWHYTEFDASAWGAAQSRQRTERAWELYSRLFQQQYKKYFSAMAEWDMVHPWIVNGNQLWSGRNGSRSDGGPFTYLVNNAGNMIEHTAFMIWSNQKLGLDPYENLEEVLGLNEYTGDDGVLFHPKANETLREEWC